MSIRNFFQKDIFKINSIENYNATVACKNDDFYACQKKLILRSNFFVKEYCLNNNKS